MKKLLFDEDGKINIFLILFVLVTILGLAIFGIASIFNKAYESKYNMTTTQEIETTTIKLCNDCKLKFNRSSLTMEANETVDISELLDIDKISLKSVKFTDYDKSIISINDAGKTLNIKSGNKLGVTTLKATYDGLTTSLKISVSQSYLTSAAFSNDVYYIYKDKENDIDVITSPLGYDKALLKYEITNQDIAYVNSDNKIVGKSVGETEIAITVNDVTSKATLYVIENKINVKVKQDGLYKDVETITYNSTIDGTTNLLVVFEDNNGMNYNYASLQDEIVSVGKMNTTATYIGDDVATGGLLYRLDHVIDKNNNASESYSIIYFSLPDGSKTRVKIVLGV